MKDIMHFISYIFHLQQSKYVKDRESNKKAQLSSSERKLCL